MVTVWVAVVEDIPSRIGHGRPEQVGPVRQAGLAGGGRCPCNALVGRELEADRCARFLAETLRPKVLSFDRPSEDEDPVSVKPVSDSVPAVGAVVSMVTVCVAVVEVFPAASVTVARNR